jgi:hypothetical protein
MLECLAHLRGVVDTIRADRSRWLQYVNHVLNWLTIAHPPFWLRRAVVWAVPPVKPLAGPASLG